jgi:hypothetical protein
MYLDQFEIFGLRSENSKLQEKEAVGRWASANGVRCSSLSPKAL